MNDLPINESSDGMNNHAVDASQEPVREEPQASAGEQLRALREARSLTAAQVANQLNLASRQIEALEQDNYAALPGMAIVRGFIRSYAKVLQVDAVPILAAINVDPAATNVLPPARSEMSASFSETQLLSDSPQRGSFLKLVFGLIIFLLLAMAALLLAQRMHWLPQKMVFSSSKIESELTKVALDNPAAVAPALTTAAPQTEAPSIKKPSVKSADETTPAMSKVAPAESTLPALVATDSATSANGDTLKSVPANADSVSGKNALVIVAHEDSWLEIRQVDDVILVSHILPAGSSEVFNITKPVSMVIGNAAGVNVTFRGKPLDVKSGSSANVARLNLK